MDLTGCVHVIEADPEVRNQLARWLIAEGCAVRLHAGPADFLADLPDLKGCCVLAALEPGGLEILRRLSADEAPAPVLLMAAQASVQDAVEAFRLGVRDVLETPVRPERLLPAVSDALAAAARRARVQALREQTASRLARLTERERDVLKGVVDGLSSKEIARVLAISHRTVETYRNNLMIKTEAASISDLVRLSLMAEAA